MSGVIKHVRIAGDGNVEILSCPERQMIEILQMHICYTSSATSGSRRIRIIIEDADGVEVADYHCGAVQTAGLTRHYTMARGVEREILFIDSSIHFSIPFGTVLLKGWKLKVADSKDIDESGDSMIVNVVYECCFHTDGGSIA